MGKKIATNVEAVPSSQKHPGDGNKTGSWQAAGAPIKSPAQKIKTENGPALFNAKANFIYNGGSNGAPAVPLPPIPSMVDLQAKPSKVVEAGKPVLLEGDQLDDAFGNKLKVSVVSAKMST